MSKKKFTEGPWSELPQLGAGPMIVRRYDTGKNMNPSGLRLVAHMLERGNSINEDRANARLIASAPRLLALLAEMCDGWPAQKPDSPYFNTYNNARALLAKIDKGE